MPQVYSRPIGPPTLAQHLAALATHYLAHANKTANFTIRLDPAVLTLRDAFRAELEAQYEAVAEHYRHMSGNSPIPREQAAADRFEHAFGEQYRKWIADMDALLWAIDNLPVHLDDVVVHA